MSADNVREQAGTTDRADLCFQLGTQLLEMEKLDEAYVLFCRGIEVNPFPAVEPRKTSAAIDWERLLS